MILFKKILIIGICIMLFVGCDYSSKKIAKNELEGRAAKLYLMGIVELRLAENTGGMLSFGDYLPAGAKIFLFQIFTGSMLLLLLAFLFFKKKIYKLESSAFILIISGGIGNLIDRIFNNGHVVDFIILNLFNYRTGIFNFADVYVMAGLILLMISKFYSWKPSSCKNIAN